jgi:hypothetical protein
LLLLLLLVGAAMGASIWFTGNPDPRLLIERLLSR